MERLLTHLSLFSGIGGLDLAAEAAGFVTVGQCEWADYPTKILEKHWPDVPRWRDIRTLTGESFYEKTGLRTVDVISGGFPCQPFSQAGKRQGKDDDRYLWPEMLRVIAEIRPAWVLGENVPGIVNLALDTVLSDLEAEGYTAQPLIIPACAVDAPHRRDRCVILAHSDCGGQVHRETKFLAEETRKPTLVESVKCGGDVANTEGTKRNGTEQRAKSPRGSRFTNGGWWDTEPDVGRVAHGIPNRVDRIKCLGNAVVPQQFYPFFAAIAEIEKES